MGKLVEILNDKRPGRKVAAMFIDMALGSPIYARLRALGFHKCLRSQFRDDAYHGPHKGEHPGLYVWPLRAELRPGGLAERLRGRVHF